MTTLHDIVPSLGRHAGDLEVSKYFVAWPGKEKGHVLHEVETILPVDQALHALFGQDAPIGVRHLCDGTLYIANTGNSPCLLRFPTKILLLRTTSITFLHTWSIFKCVVNFLSGKCSPIDPLWVGLWFTT